MIQDIRDVDQSEPVVTQALLEDAQEFLKGIIGLTPEPLSDPHRTWNLGAYAGYMVAFGVEPVTTLHEVESVFFAGPLNYRDAKSEANRHLKWDAERHRTFLYACGMLYGYKKGIVECRDADVCTSCDRGLRTEMDDAVVCECGAFCNDPHADCFREFHLNATRSSCPTWNDHQDIGWED